MIGTILFRVCENPNFHPRPHYRAPLYEICWGLHEVVLYVPPQNICRTGAVIVGVGGEIMAVNSNNIYCVIMIVITIIVDIDTISTIDWEHCSYQYCEYRAGQETECEAGYEFHDDYDN